MSHVLSFLLICHLLPLPLNLLISFDWFHLLPPHLRYPPLFLFHHHHLQFFSTTLDIHVLHHPLHHHLARLLCLVCLLHDMTFAIDVRFVVRLVLVLLLLLLFFLSLLPTVMRFLVLSGN